MSDILEEIQELSNKFSNLFEVDDLGQPAMDVPPSQNKIKRDRKTKDGKVELVSVEDELFPYEGNKREQYRQKILDTINNMIQGKATLEDLLQIVRQKKAPLKEAIELMEDIKSAIEKKHGKPEYYSGRSPWQVGKEPANKSAELTQKANEIKEKEALQAAERELDKDRPDLKDAHPAKKNYKVADYYGQIMARRNGKAPLKEAMEVLEDIYTMIDKKYPEGSREKSLLKIKAQNNRLRSYHDMDSRKPINGENSIDKAIGAYTKNAKGNAKTDSRRDVVDQEYANLDRENDSEGKKATQKSIDRHFDKVLYKPLKSQANITRKAVATEKFKRMNSEALEEAIELVEELLLERNKENRDKKEKWELKTNNITKKYKKAIQDYAKQEGDEAKYHRAAAADYDHIYSQQPAKAPDGSPNSVAAYFNGKYQEMLRNKGRNEQNIADEVEPLTKKLKNRKHSFHDRVRGWTEPEALEEAMEVLEELIGEGRNLEDVVVRGYNKGKVSLDDLQKLMDKAHEVPSDSSYFHKSKGEKGELRTKHRHMDYERNVLSDGWGKDDNKKIEASIKRKAKNDKSFPVFQALKAYKEGKADIKEALEIMEDIWSKIQEQPSDKKEELTRMYYKMKQKEGKTTSDIIDDRKKHMTKQEKGQEKTKERNQKAWKNYLDAVRDYTENTPSMYQFEALEKALSLTEEIINEVSVGALARAVENNLPKRKKNEEVAIKAYKQAQNEYEKGSKESPEDEPALYKKLQCTDKAACKEFDKARDAENLKDLNLPKDSKVSANKLFNAAKKVNPERQKKTEETVKNTKGTKEDAKKFLNSLKRDNRSFDISLADPVKSRNEAN